jgi:hypothetical protein
MQLDEFEQSNEARIAPDRDDIRFIYLGVGLDAISKRLEL